MAGWRQMRFADFLSIQRGHDLPEQTRVSGTVPILGSFGITGWHNEARAKGPGITIGRSGASFGTVAMSAVDFWPLNTALYVTDFNGNDVRFCYYLLKTIDFAGYNSGSAQPSLNRNFIADVPLLVPPLPEQRAIAGVLGALDDKIEANRRMNSTLEAMARALFKSWFVDFDPVRAKMARSAEGATKYEESREPAIAPDLAALFPAHLTDSPLGPIPEGWAVSTIGKAVEVIGGNTPSTAEPSYWGGDHAWVTPKDLSGLSEPVLLSTDRTLTDEGLARVSSGLLPVDTVLLSSRAPIGYLAIAKLPVAVNQGFVAMVCSGRIGAHFVYFWASFAHDEIVNRANGSTFLEISKGSFRGIEFAVPTPEACNQFEAIARPTFERIASNARQSRTLAQLRDLLLPKLLSGALRVRDAEAMVEDAA